MTTEDTEELAALRKDRERLEWVLGNCPELSCINKLDGSGYVDWEVYNGNTVYKGSSGRAAIDAAMEATK